MSLSTKVALALCAVALLGAAAQEPDRHGSSGDSDSLLQTHLAAARKAQAATDCHLAAQEYHAAARLLPSSGELRTNEGIALYCDKQFTQSVSALRTALQLNHDLTVPHLFLGFAAFHLGHSGEAARELRLYLDHAPDNVTAHLWLGYALTALNDPLAASAQFRQVLQHDPNNIDAKYALGEAALSLAHSTAVQIQALDPTGSHLLQLAAARYRMTGDETHAAAAAQESATRLAGGAAASAETSRKLDDLLQQAEAQQAEALDAFGAILRAAPQSYRAHEVTGDALVAAQQQPAAIPEYEQVIRLKPDLPGVHETLSQCLMTTGRFADALAALETELALSPGSATRLQTRIGQTRLSMGDDAGAAQALELAVKDPAVPSQAYLLLGELRLRQGRPADAVPLLRRYIASDSGNATAFYHLSRAYRALDDRPAMTQALADYKRTSQDIRARELMTPVINGGTASSFTAVIPGPGEGTAAAATPKAN